MDLIAKVREALKPLGMSSPTYELTLDANGNVSGFVSDALFGALSDEVAQQKIWEQLRKEFSEEEQRSVLAIFHESPTQRAMRRSGVMSPDSPREHFFKLDRGGDRYWLFVDVTRIADEYKALFFLCRAEPRFVKALTFSYSDEVIEFMELSGEELYAELHRNAFSNGEAELKAVLMDKYSKLEETGNVGASNPYWYVFNDFRLKPCPVHELRFDAAEVALLEAHQKQLEPYTLWRELAKAIDLSKLHNQIRGTSI